MYRQLRESLSERLRSEVQVSAALWQIKHNDEKASSGTNGGANGNSQRSVASTNVKSSEDGFPCPREVKPLLFFYKYLQPIGGGESVGVSDDSNTSAPTNSSSQRKLRVNLPLTVVCERSNAQEMVLWLRTDAQGNVIRDEKTPLWRKKLHNELLGTTTGSAVSPPDSQESDPVLAVRSVARWKNTNKSSGGSAVVLTRKTLDPVLAVPCELPICIQQFVHCRGSQASVYRIFWCPQERKCFAVNLTSSLKSTEAPEDAEAINNSSVPTTTASMSGVSVSTMAAMNAAFEAAMVIAAQTARFYCVTVSPDARACARWPKLRGAAISEGVQATSRIVEHVQMQLPTLRFHSMTVDFIKDTSGVWWLTRVVDFKASSTVEPIRDEGGFGTRDSAVLISEALRTKNGRTNNESQLDDPESPPRGSTLLRGDEFNNALNARICFLCGCSCELTPTFRDQLTAMLKGDSGAEYKETSTIAMEAPAIDEFRMTLTMALDTIFFMRQRGVGLPAWENAVSTVRKSQVRDVCDFPTCMLCYRIYQQQNRLQLIARELHNALSSNATCSDEDTEVANNFTADGISMATSAASGLAASQLLSTELQHREETPKNVLEALEAFRAETIPASLLLRGDSPENRPTWSILSPVRGADVDPIATQLRLVFFFHELQDGGPDLKPTDFFLEYQLGQNVTRVHLEGSKRHTPNRWQLCEARIHYLCATLDAFNEFCLHKRLLIKLKAKRRSQREKSESDELEDVENTARDEDGVSGSSTGDSTRYRDKEEFFGYTLLPLRTVNTAAKWFGNSLQSESRTDYLLELHTASYGLLTLKLTVGLLVDPVPLGHVRDVLRECIFLEEQQPRGVYWPPTSHCLGGLAVPRDWVGALMPSEYTKILPMRRRGAYGARPLTPSGSSGSTSQTIPSVIRGNSADVVEAVAATSNEKPDQGSTARKMSNVTMEKTETPGELAYSCVAGGSDLVAGANTDQEKPEYHKSRSLRLIMNGTTLSRVCMAAKRIVFRITEDAATKNFPTLLLAAILRHSSFANPISSLSSWKSPARFQFTRKYTVDHLLAEVKPDNVPLLGLLGELLHVLIENHALPSRVDASALELVLKPFWQQDSGWHSIPRTQTSCLPERRVIWNRAIRRWVAVTDNTTMIDEIVEPARQPEGNMESIMPHHGSMLTTVIGEFRAKTVAVVLCELFEKMETLDNEYIEIAELRSLAKCLPDEKCLCVEEQLDTEVGTRERLTQDALVVLSELVDQQQRLTLRSLLHSMMGSTVMIDALARFDRVGSGEMSLEEFRELAAEALLSQRRTFCAFPEEPTKSHDGFCIRHGSTELYATDSACVQCSVEYQVITPPSEHFKSPENSPEYHEPTTTDVTCTTLDAGRRFNLTSTLSRRSTDREFYPEGMQNLEREKTRRVSSAPPTLDKFRRISSSKSGFQETEGVHTNSRRRAIGGRRSTSRQKVDMELETVLNQLHAAERIVVIGEAQPSERKTSTASVRTRQSSTTSEYVDMPPTSYFSIANLERYPSTRSTMETEPSHICYQDDASADANKVAKKKKRIKKKILKKIAQRTKLTNTLPPPDSLSKLLRIELSDRRRFLATSASETIIEKAVRIEEKRKQLDRLVLAEVQEVKQRLAKLFDEASRVEL